MTLFGATDEAWPNRFSATELAGILSRYRLPVSNEAELQVAIARALSAEGVPYRRELTKGRDRLDFYVCPTGIECKVQGSVSEVARQLYRYAKWDSVRELLLVTTRVHHGTISRELNGKPVHVHIVRGMF